MADNFGAIYRFSAANIVSGPLLIGQGGTVLQGGGDNLVEVVVGDNGAAALVQDWWRSSSYSRSAKIVPFNPQTLTTGLVSVLSDTAPPGTGLRPRQLKEALAGGGGAFSDFRAGYST